MSVTVGCEGSAKSDGVREGQKPGRERQPAGPLRARIVHLDLERQIGDCTAHSFPEFLLTRFFTDSTFRKARDRVGHGCRRRRALMAAGERQRHPSHWEECNMVLKARTLVPLALAATALTMLVAADFASATHPRPVGASPIRVSMVPAYNACAAPNRTHGPPLAFPSCNPPVQSSTALTIGSPDGRCRGELARVIKIGVMVGVPGPPDVRRGITASATDIRWKAGVAACGSANAGDGEDYTGELEARADPHLGPLQRWLRAAVLTRRRW